MHSTKRARKQTSIKQERKHVRNWQSKQKDCKKAFTSDGRKPSSKFGRTQESKKAKSIRAWT